MIWYPPTTVPEGNGAGFGFDIIGDFEGEKSCMPVYSMTGYASATAGAGATSETGTISDSASPRPAGAAASVMVELRSVNGRFLDLNFRLPDELRSLEPALRDLLDGALRRGKVEMRLTTRAESDAAWPQPQPDQLNQLGRLESTVQGWLPKAQG